jgi:hypothetical protein
MSQHMEAYLKVLELVKEARFQNMAVFPVFTGNGSGTRYLSLDEALELNLLRVTEVSESGDVPNLLVTNEGEIPILILAGEELVGAKQNRLVNATFLVAGLSKITVPVSCVEQGRWGYRGREFKSERRMSSPQLRSKVEEDVSYAVREQRGFRANQSRVWGEIGAKSARLAVHSETMAMAAMYESYDDQLKDYVEKFPQAAGQTGFLAAISGRMAGMELFDSADNLGKYFDKLIQSYALDAIDLKRQEQRQSPQTTKEKAEGWMAEVKKAQVTLNPSIGLGEDLRIEGGGIIGSGLLLNETMLYLSIFAKSEGGEQGRSSSRMARASKRGIFSREP